jgi:hypothetical protein
MFNTHIYICIYIIGMSKIQEAELFGLRNDVQKLLNENETLHSRMTTMQGELMYMLKIKIDGKEGTSL